MAGKVSLTVIWPSFKNKISHGVILLKRSYISLIIATRGSECENNLKEVMTWESFPNVAFDL